MPRPNRPPIPRSRIPFLLGKLPLFRGLWDEELQEVISICRTTRVEADQTLFDEDDPSDSMYVLLVGAIELRTRKVGKLYTVLPGDVFGEIGMLSQRRRTATAVPKESSDLVRIERDDFNVLLGRAPRISAVILRNITEHLSDHLVRMNNRLSTDFLPNPAESPVS